MNSDCNNPHEYEHFAIALMQHAYWVGRDSSLNLVGLARLVNEGLQ